MFLYAVLMVNEGSLTFTEAITPFLPLLGIVVGGLIVSLFGVWNRRRGAMENRAPDVNESWVRADSLDKALDQERRLRRLLQDILHDVLRAFRGYVSRAQAGGSVELTTSELKAHSTKVPDIGD